jgi:hypothetical protein
MAKRSTLQLSLIWVLVDMMHPRADLVLANAQAFVEQRLPGTVMSINYNLDRTQALVKITTEPGFIETLPGAARNAIIREFTEADHHEALVLVRNSAWEPHEEEII